MANLNLNGPYQLTMVAVNREVTKVSAGNYALGHINENGGFVPKYVGRSDSDISKRLLQHVNDGLYKSFKYSYETSPKAAFEKECVNYHDFIKQLDNKIHPDRPDNSKSWKCPVCDIYD